MTSKPSKMPIYWVGFVVPKTLFGHPTHDPLMLTKPCIVRVEAGYPAKAIPACIAAAQDHIRRPLVVALTDIITAFYAPPHASHYDKLIVASRSHPMHSRILYLARAALRQMSASNVIPGPGHGGIYLADWEWPNDPAAPTPNPPEAKVP